MEPSLLAFDIPATPALPAHRLACTRFGNDEKAPAVICVHGLTRNSRDFDILASSLADRYRVFCPDMPGRGDSSPLPNPALYNYATYAADVTYLLNTLGLQQVHWIGTSMGGIIGMMLANALPGRLRSMVLNDVGCLIPATGLKRILGYAGVKTGFASRADAEIALREAAAPFGIVDESHWQHLFTHSIRQTADGKINMHYDPAIAAGFDRSNIQDINLWTLWPGVLTIPTLLIRGMESDILPREVASAMQMQHPRLTLYEVEGAGHAPALMADKQIAFIREWMNAL